MVEPLEYFMNHLSGLFTVSRITVSRTTVNRKKVARLGGVGPVLGMLGVAAGLLLGCQATARQPEVNSSTEAESESAAAPQAAEKALSADAARDSENPHPTDAPRAPQFQLRLPTAEGFVKQPLPPAHAERYRSWRETYRLAVNQSHLYLAAALGGSKHIVVKSGNEASVRVYEKASKKLLGNYSFGQQEFENAPVLPWIPAHGSAVGNEDSFLLGSSGGLSLYAATTGLLRKQLSELPFDLLAWSPDAQVLVARVSNEDNGGSTLVFFQRTGPEGLTQLGELDLAERVDAYDLSRDNRLLAVSYYPSGNVEIFDLREGATLSKFVGPNYVSSLHFSPDGRALAIGGQGLLLVDLITPHKRTYYSYFANNINTVRFSPSGDAIATSSYDGRIRIFSYALTPAGLSLIQTLNHAGIANVYSIEFSRDGNELMSASGDQSVRRFGAQPSAATSSGSQASFHTLNEWRTLLPAAEQMAPPAIVPSMKEGHYWPPSLNGPARPSRIKPGKYACKITTMYRLRDCTVTVDSRGHTLLEFAKDNLFGLKGVLYDDGSVTRYEAWLTEPSNIYDCRECEKQPIHAVFRGTGNNFTGILLLKNIYDERSAPPQPAADIKFEEADDRMPLTLQYRGPLTESDRSAD